MLSGERNVIFVSRGAHLAALRERGLTVESKLGDVSLPKVQATDDPSTLGSVDVVLIGALRLFNDLGQVFGAFKAFRIKLSPSMFAGLPSGVITTSFPIRAFLSMMAPSITALRPVPIDGSPDFDGDSSW
jgi:hypothetical protein